MDKIKEIFAVIPEYNYVRNLENNFVVLNIMKILRIVHLIVVKKSKLEL